MPPIKIKLSDAASSDPKKQVGLTKEDDVVDTTTYNSEAERLLAKFKEDGKKSLDQVVDAFMSEKRELGEKLKSAQQQVLQLTEDIEQITGVQRRLPDLDGLLESQFMDLKEQVRSFTSKFCDRPILSPLTPLSLPEHVKKALMVVSGVSTTRLLKSALHAQYFVQALIWRLLCDNIFANPFLIWGKDNRIGDFILKAQSSRKILKRRRQFWRAMTGQILVEIATPRPCRIAIWQKILVDNIGPLVTAKFRDNIEEHIKPILHKAIELAGNLAQSRTECTLRRKSPDADDKFSQKYDEKWMEVVEKAVLSYEDIDFLVAPALIQLTNSLGESFNNPRVIVKAEVCFGRGRLPASAP
ncbi:hypothetical protein F4803DRAFT_570495 [Xylaria telfairii]|nr:hypothetical protein F4803DRAFT_570495 [Xylaria telfairii]